MEDIETRLNQYSSAFGNLILDKSASKQLLIESYKKGRTNLIRDLKMLRFNEVATNLTIKMPKINLTVGTVRRGCEKAIFAINQLLDLIREEKETETFHDIEMQ